MSHDEALRDTSPADLRGERDQLALLWQAARASAHQLNNAYTVILAEASFIESESKATPELLDACSQIQEQTERCAAVARSLLALGGSGGPRGCRLASALQRIRPLVDGVKQPTTTFELRCDEAVIVSALTEGEVATIALGLILHGEALAVGAACIRVSAASKPEAEAETSRLRVEIESEGIETGAAPEAWAPGTELPQTLDVPLYAALSIASRAGGSLEVQVQPGRIELSLCFAQVAAVE